MPRKKIPVQTPGAAPVADDKADEQPPQPQVEPKQPQAPARKVPDASTLQTPVLTEHGWLCPKTKAKAKT